MGVLERGVVQPSRAVQRVAPIIETVRQTRSSVPPNEKPKIGTCPFI